MGSKCIDQKERYLCPEALHFNESTEELEDDRHLETIAEDYHKKTYY